MILWHSQYEFVEFSGLQLKDRCGESQRRAGWNCRALMDELIMAFYSGSFGCSAADLNDYSNSLSVVPHGCRIITSNSAQMRATRWFVISTSSVRFIVLTLVTVQSGHFNKRRLQADWSTEKRMSPTNNGTKNSQATWKEHFRGTFKVFKCKLSLNSLHREAQTVFCRND